MLISLFSVHLSTLSINMMCCDWLCTSTILDSFENHSKYHIIVNCCSSAFQFTINFKYLSHVVLVPSSLMQILWVKFAQKIDSSYDNYKILPSRKHLFWPWTTFVIRLVTFLLLEIWPVNDCFMATDSCTTYQHVKLHFSLKLALVLWCYGWVMFC